MTSLPTTLTVENLKKIQGFLATTGWSSESAQRSRNNNLALLDSWIAELSPMEEPKENGQVFILTNPKLFTYPVAVQGHEIGWIMSGGIDRTPKTWQEILAIDSRPQIIYTPEGSE